MTILGCLKCRKSELAVARATLLEVFKWRLEMRHDRGPAAWSLGGTRRPVPEVLCHWQETVRGNLKDTQSVPRDG